MRAAALLLLALPVVLWVAARLAWEGLTASEAERAYMDGTDDDGGSWPEFGGGVAPGDPDDEDAKYADGFFGSLANNKGERKA